MSPLPPGVIASSRRRTSAVFDIGALSAPLHTHYDALTQTAADGATVTTLVDQSGNSRNATKAGSGSITYDADGINGRGCWNFPGGPYVDTAPFASIGSTAIHVFAVAAFVTLTGDRMILGPASGFTLALGLTSGKYYINRGGANGIGGAVTAGPHRLRALYANEGVAGPSTLHVDGEQVVTAYVGGAANTTFRIGASGSGFAPLVAKVAEVAVFRGALASDEIAAVESHLSTKWGV